MTACLDGEELGIARVSRRSGGGHYSTAGSGDDLSVKFTFHTLDGPTDPDPDGLNSVSVFFGDATGPVADGERSLGEEELVGFSSGGSVPAAEGTIELAADEVTPADGLATLAFDVSRRAGLRRPPPGSDAGGPRLRPGPTHVHSSLIVDGSGDLDGGRVPAGQEALATIERSRMATSSP